VDCFFVHCEAKTSQQATYSVARQQELGRYKRKRGPLTTSYITRAFAQLQKKYWLRHMRSSSVLPCAHFSLYIQGGRAKKFDSEKFHSGRRGGGWFLKRKKSPEKLIWVEIIQKYQEI